MKILVKTILLVFTVSLCAASLPDDAQQLKDFFTLSTFLAGRNTPARCLTDRILNKETELLLEQLYSKDPELKRNAFYTLRMRKRAIEHAIKSKREIVEFTICKLRNFKMDGDISEWKNIQPLSRGSFASFPVSEDKKADDGSLWYVAENDGNICFAAYFKDNNIIVDTEKPWSTDSLELFFISPGNGWQYCEIIVSPGYGITLSKQQNYTGTGTRIETADSIAEKSGIKGATRRFADGYSAEISVPLKSFNIKDEKISFMLVRTSDGRAQRTPVECVSEGHDIFGFINGNITERKEEKTK